MEVVATGLGDRTMVTTSWSPLFSAPAGGCWAVMTPTVASSRGTLPLTDTVMLASSARVRASSSVRPITSGAALSPRKTRKVAARIIPVATVLLIVALAAATFLVFRGDNAAPDVIGLTLEEARTLAEEANMTVSVKGSVPRLDATVGVITAQEPPAGAEKSGDQLVVTIVRSPKPVATTSMTDYDPDGDNSENGDLVAKLIDGNTESYWATEDYGPGYFQESKSGVGIRFQLEEPATLVEVFSPDEGWAGALLSENEDGTTAELAKLEGSNRQTVTLDEPLATGRIWIESLVARESDGRMQVRLAEVRFYHNHQHNHRSAQD